MDKKEIKDVKQDLIKKIKEVALYTNEKGEIKQGYEDVLNLWENTPLELQRESIIEVIKTLAIYTNEKGEIEQGSLNVLNIWLSTPLELQRESIIEVIKTLAIYTNEKGEIEQGDLNVFILWRYTPLELQREMFSKILTYFTSIKYNDESNKEQVQINNLRRFLLGTPQEIIKEHYEEICEIALSFEDKDNALSRTLISSIPSFKDLDEEIIKKINDGNLIARVNLEQLDKIKVKFNKDVPIYLEIADVSELPIKKIEELKNEGINLKYVGMKSKAKEDLDEEIPYTIEKYVKIRKKLDEMLGCVNQKGDQLEIFVQIVQTICKHISYDHSAYAEERVEKKYSSRNLEGSLLQGMCVCVGYAELLRNMSICCGIDALFVGGNEHAWNQVKINDVWYNVDITFDRNRIKCGEEPHWLLKSDEEFQIDKTHIPDKDSFVEECNISMPQELFVTFFHYEKFLTEHAMKWKNAPMESQRKLVVANMQSTNSIVEGFGSMLYWTSTLPEVQREKIMEAIETLATSVDENGQVQQRPKNIFYLWKNTSLEIQKEKFLEVLNYFSNATYKDEFNNMQVQNQNLEKFLQSTPKTIIEENYEEIYRIAHECNNTELLRILMNALTKVPPEQATRLKANQLHNNVENSVLGNSLYSTIKQSDLVQATGSFSEEKNENKEIPEL